MPFLFGSLVCSSCSNSMWAYTPLDSLLHAQTPPPATCISAQQSVGDWQAHLSDSTDRGQEPRNTLTHLEASPKFAMQGHQAAQGGEQPCTSGHAHSSLGTTALYTGSSFPAKACFTIRPIVSSLQLLTKVWAPSAVHRIAL